MDPIRIFVYGTLKEYHGNHKHYLTNAKKLGRDSVPGVLLHLNAGFPGLVRETEEPKVCRVNGEVYEIDTQTLLSLDHLEGTPHMYVREQVTTTKGEVVFVYVWNRPHHLMDNTPVINHGMWKGDGHDIGSYANLRNFYKRVAAGQAAYSKIPSTALVALNEERRVLGVSPLISTLPPLKVAPPVVVKKQPQIGPGVEAL